MMRPAIRKTIPMTITDMIVLSVYALLKPPSPFNSTSSIVVGITDDLDLIAIL